jgi:HlyD family secretion protein
LFSLRVFSAATGVDPRPSFQRSDAEFEMDEDTHAAAPPIVAPSVALAGAQSRALVPAPKPAPLPVAPLGSKPKAARRRWPRIALALAVVAGVAGGAFYVWRQSQPRLPPGIVFGNGRIEADEIDIDTKFAGRIAETLADEGDMVKESQALAPMDTRLTLETVSRTCRH